MEEQNAQQSKGSETIKRFGKILWMILLILPLAGMFSLSVSAAGAASGNVSGKEDNVLSLDPTSELFHGLPQETKEILQSLNLTEADCSGLASSDMGEILSEILSVIAQNSGTPFIGFTVCLGMILLCSLTESIRLGSTDKKLETVQYTVAALCVCSAVVIPFCQTISRLTEVLQGASGFMLLYVPILSGLMVGTGREVTGSSWYGSMMMVGNLISSAAAHVIMPLMNVFLALSVTGSVAGGLKLGSICESVYKIAKWVLTFLMSVFMTVLSLNTLVTTSMDQVSRRAVKFAVSSFVPVVGGVLSEALTTFNGSLEMLKTGAGVFVIIAAAFILLPVLAECVIWQFSLFLLSSVSEISGLDRMMGLFRSVSKAAGMMTALLLCVLTVFMISTVMILIVGQQGV